MGILSIFGMRTSKLIATQLDDISRKMSMCKDLKVKATAEELMSSLNGSISKKSQKVINKAEHLLDTVNTSNGEYCTLYSEWAPNAVIKKQPFIFDLYPKKMQKSIRERFSSAPRVVRNLSNKPEFENIENLSSLKRFISRYSDDKEMINYLYDNYYLKNIDNKDFVDYLRKIDKEFGIKLFADKPLRKSSQLYIYEELNNFKKASMCKEKFPPLIDITDFDPMVNIAHANGICVKSKWLEQTQYGARVAVQESFMKKYQGLRHELIHWFDKKLGITKLSEGKAKIKPDEIKEMCNANVQNLSYAYNCDNDFKAVWGQGSMSKYSDKIKQKMIKKGIPEWITTLDDVSLKKYLDEIFTDEKSKKTLNEIRENLKRDFPEELVYKMIDNPQNLEKYSELLKYKDSTGNPMFLYGLDSYIDLPKEKLAFVEKFSKLKVKKLATEDMIAQGLKDNHFCVSLDDLGYRVKDFSVEQLEKIYQKAQKCETIEDYEKLQCILDRYLDIKRNNNIKKTVSKFQVDKNKVFQFAEKIIKDFESKTSLQ